MLRAAGQLLPHERRMLDILQARQAWMSRRDIARVLKRGKLYASEIQTLTTLAAHGLIEVRRVPGRGQRLHYEYRAIPLGSEALAP